MLFNELEISNRVDEALEVGLAIIDMDPSDFNNLEDVISLYKQNKDYQNAEQLLKNYSTNHPENYRPYYLLGHYYRDIGEFEKAKDEYETASLLESDNNAIKISLCKLETKFGNFDSAINQLINLLNNPNNTTEENRNIYEELSEIYKKIGKIGEAIKYGEKQYELHPNWGDLRRIFDAVALAKLYILNNDYQSVEIRINELKNQYSDSVMGLVLEASLSEIYLWQNKLKKVEEALLKAERIASDYGIAGFEYRRKTILGKVFENKKDYKNALKYYKPGLVQNPTWYLWGGYPQPRSVGRCYRKLKEYNLSEEYLVSALNEDPYHPKTHYELGLLYHEMEAIEKATNHLQLAVKIWKNADEDYSNAREAKSLLNDWQ